MLGGDAGRIIHDGLMRALDANDPCVESTRQPSMCHDGTSVVCTVKVGPGLRDSFRVLVEPGSLSDGVARQIAFSLTVIDQLLTRLSWQDAASDINTVTTRVLPGDVAAADRCWGGIWLRGAHSSMLGRRSRRGVENLLQPAAWRISDALAARRFDAHQPFRRR